jgi:FKBP-type peptidyl-prolyl cis-trans isomerase
MKMKVRNLMVGFFVGSCFIISACDNGGETPDELQRWYEEVAIIDSDLAAAGIIPVKDPESGISMIISKLGTGLPAQKNNILDVDYIGRRYEDKVVFDQGSLTTLKLSDLIPGWQIAFSKLPAGSEAKLIIPSLYAYGVQGSGPSIPGNTILEFDVKFNEAKVSSAEASRLGTDSTAIDNYLAGKGIDAIKDSTGLRYVITTPGTGPVARWYDKLTLKYTFKLLTDDTKTIISLDRSPSDTFYSRPVDYIMGMIIGLQKLSAGSKAVLYIPSGLAFGAEGASDGAGASIPANANIIVEVEMGSID